MNAICSLRHFENLFLQREFALWACHVFISVIVTVTWSILDIDTSGDEVEGSGRGTGGRIVGSGHGRGRDDEDDTVYSGSGSGDGSEVDKPSGHVRPDPVRPTRPIGGGGHKTNKPNYGIDEDPNNPRYTVSTKKPDSGAQGMASGAVVIVSVLYTVCRMFL